MTTQGIEKKLTQRQWRTINLLKEAAEKDPNAWVTQEEIIKNTPIELFKDGYSKAESTSHDQCTGVWIDIKAINDSSEFDTIIIYKDFKAKLATYEEAKDYISYIENKAMKLLTRMGTLKRKLKNDGKGKFTESEEIEFTESVLQNHRESMGV